MIRMSRMTDESILDSMNRVDPAESISIYFGDHHCGRHCLSVKKKGYEEMTLRGLGGEFKIERNQINRWSVISGKDVFSLKVFCRTIDLESYALKYLAQNILSLVLLDTVCKFASQVLWLNDRGIWHNQGMFCLIDQLKLGMKFQSDIEKCMVRKYLIRLRFDIENCKANYLGKPISDASREVKNDLLAAIDNLNR